MTKMIYKTFLVATLVMNSAAMDIQTTTSIVAEQPLPSRGYLFSILEAYNRPHSATASPVVSDSSPPKTAVHPKLPASSPVSASTLLEGVTPFGYVFSVMKAYKIVPASAIPVYVAPGKTLRKILYTTKKLDTQFLTSFNKQYPEIYRYELSRYIRHCLSIREEEVSDDTREAIRRTKELELSSASNELYEQIQREEAYYHHFPNTWPSEPIGLTNQGNTCYLNAALQCVLAYSPLSQRLLALPADAYSRKEELEKDELALAYYNVVKEYAQASKASHKYYRPAQFYNTLAKIPMAQGAQHDSSEPIAHLLSELTQHKKLQSQHRFSNPFQFQLARTSVCGSCNATSSRKHTPSTLFSLPYAATFPEALDSYFKTETLNGENMVYCNSKPCNNQKRPRTNQTHIMQLSDVLCVNPEIIHQDFAAATFVRVKERSFRFPVRINLHKYCTPDLQKKFAREKLYYNILGICIHIGDAGGGHYWSLVRYGNQWWHCNDGSVKAVEDAEILSLATSGYHTLMGSTPYLLFYEKSS